MGCRWFWLSFALCWLASRRCWLSVSHIVKLFIANHSAPGRSLFCHVQTRIAIVYDLFGHYTNVLDRPSWQLLFFWLQQDFRAVTIQRTTSIIFLDWFPLVLRGKFVVQVVHWILNVFAHGPFGCLKILLPGSWLKSLQRLCMSNSSFSNSWKSWPVSHKCRLYATLPRNLSRLSLAMSTIRLCGIVYVLSAYLWGLSDT